MVEANLSDHGSASELEKRVVSPREAEILRRIIGKEFIRLFDPHMQEAFGSHPSLGWEEPDWQRERALCEFRLAGPEVPEWLRPSMLALSSDGAIVKYREESPLPSYEHQAPVFVALIGSHTKPEKSIAFKKWGTGLPGLPPEYELPEEYFGRLGYRDVEGYRLPSLIKTLHMADISALNWRES